MLKIVTRESRLALWQTSAVKEKLNSLGYPSQLVLLKTLGDIDLVNPIYAMGVQGVFTKELDSALLNNRADLAVHSLKDVPTVLPKGLTIAAVLERASYHDVLVHSPQFDPRKEKAVIATSSLRRKSQWLHRFPNHTMVNVRGNVETRLKKFIDEGWDGIIFAQAGLERLGLLPEKFQVLEWMVPAPAQGAIVVICKEDNHELYNVCRNINDELTEICVSVERDFLYHLEGGCSVPISILARINDDRVHVQGALHSLDGKREFRIEMNAPLKQWETLGEETARHVKKSEKGILILAEFRKLNRN